MNVHPTALVHPGAELAGDVEVMPFSIIEDKVRLGAGTVIGPHCVIGGGTVMGRNNRTFSGAQIGAPPQDLKHLRNVVGQTIIGDNNVFRESVTVSSSTVYSEEDHHKRTVIGNDCLFMACSHVAHDCTVGDRVILANSAALAGHVSVQSGATLGGLVGVHQFCTVGAMAFIGGMSRINMDVLPYMIMEGHPARCYGPNVVGLTRNGFSKDAIGAIRKMFKIIYRSGLNMTQALQELEKTLEACPEKQCIVEFIQNSRRGISR